MFGKSFLFEWNGIETLKRMEGTEGMGEGVEEWKGVLQMLQTTIVLGTDVKSPTTGTSIWFAQALHST